MLDKQLHDLQETSSEAMLSFRACEWLQAVVEGEDGNCPGAGKGPSRRWRRSATQQLCFGSARQTPPQIDAAVEKPVKELIGIQP
ncbi:MAG: hypothetical protein AAF501_20120 [Pseudomonadota bacterium]